HHLVEEYGYTKLAFADEVKHLAADMVNLVRAKANLAPIGIDEVNANKALYRPLLQWLGTDLVRETIDPNFWVNRLCDRFTAIDGPVVVDDMRFPNEAAALRSLGFRFVVIRADERFRFDTFLAKTQHPAEDVAAKWEEVNNHPSERHYEAIETLAAQSTGLFT